MIVWRSFIGTVAVGALLLGCSDDGVTGASGTTGDDGTAGSGVSASMSDTGVLTGMSGDDTTGTNPGTEGPEGTTSGSTGPVIGTSSDDGSTGGGSSSGGSSSGGGSSGGGSSGSSSSEGGSTAGPGDSAIGEDCTEDSECMTGVCWDFADYDPFCGGAVCSAECEGDDDCVAAFTAAGAPFPNGATCGFDGRCDPIGSGFGAFFCAAPQ